MSRDIEAYFSRHSRSWIADSYDGDGYLYPTARARGPGGRDGHVPNQLQSVTNIKLN